MALEHKVNALQTELTDVQELVVQLVEENVSLTMERDNYKDLHDEETKTTSYKENTLERLYNEGFHVCNIHFGTHRQNEECLFCRDFIRVEH